MSGVFSRSWELVRETWSVLMKDKELLVFPILSASAVILIIASFIVPLIFMGLLGTAAGPLLMIISLFIFYFLAYFIVIFFNTGLIACAHIRLSGGDPTIMDGIGIALRHVSRIAGWALVSATVGLVLSTLSRKGGVSGRLVLGIGGAAWSIVTFFVIPEIIFEERGVWEAIKESWSLFRRTWGENIVGSIGLGIIFLPALLVLLGILLAAFTGSMLLIPLVVVFILLLGICGVILSTLRGIFIAALYHYAKTGTIPHAFSNDLVSEAFTGKTRPGPGQL